MNIANLSLNRPRPYAKGQWAAVAIIIDLSRKSVLTVKRVERENDPWSGDVAFPGGKYAENDADLVETAKRETLEETGIILSDADFKGIINAQSPSNDLSIYVIPSVFMLNKVSEIKLSANELQSFHWIPLDLHDAMLIKQKMKGFYENWTIIYDGITVWGMTYRILKSLFETMGLDTLPWDSKEVK